MISNNATLPTRAGQGEVPKESARSYILVVLANDRPGTVDRIVGLLRRRRAGAQSIIIGRDEASGTVRITVSVNDSEVGIEQLAEQLRKGADVRHVVNVTNEQSVTRELALIKVNSPAANLSEILELGNLFGAHVAEVGQETITLEVTGSAEKIEKLLDQLQRFGVLDLARTGSVAITRETI